jgi:hypothetical protein
MIRKYVLSLKLAFLSFLFLFPVGDALSSPLLLEVILLREPNTRGFLTLFDVALILSLVASISFLRKYPKKISRR